MFRKLKYSFIYDALTVEGIIKGSGNPLNKLITILRTFGQFKHYTHRSYFIYQNYKLPYHMSDNSKLLRAKEMQMNEIINLIKLRIKTLKEIRGILPYEHVYIEPHEILAIQKYIYENNSYHLDIITCSTIVKDIIVNDTLKLKVRAVAHERYSTSVVKLEIVDISEVVESGLLHHVLVIPGIETKYYMDGLLEKKLVEYKIFYRKHTFFLDLL